MVRFNIVSFATMKAVFVQRKNKIRFYWFILWIRTC